MEDLLYQKEYRIERLYVEYTGVMLCNVHLLEKLLRFA